MLGPFAFTVFLFCLPIGGRDSLTKRKIHKMRDRDSKEKHICVTTAFQGPEGDGG